MATKNKKKNETAGTTSSTGITENTTPTVSTEESSKGTDVTEEPSTESTESTAPTTDKPSNEVVPPVTQKSSTNSTKPFALAEYISPNINKNSIKEQRDGTDEPIEITINLYGSFTKILNPSGLKVLVYKNSNERVYCKNHHTYHTKYFANNYDYDFNLNTGSCTQTFRGIIGAKEDHPVASFDMTTINGVVFCRYFSDHAEIKVDVNNYKLLYDEDNYDYYNIGYSVTIQEGTFVTDKGEKNKYYHKDITTLGTPDFVWEDFNV